MQSEITEPLCSLFDAYAAANGYANLQVYSTLDTTLSSTSIYTNVLPDRSSGYGCTRSKRRYAGRLLGFAVLAQLPYQLAFPANGIAGFVQFNMLFTLLLCFLVLLVQEKIRDRVLRGVCIVLLICASLFCDWALLAPVFTLLFAWAGGNRTRQKAAFGAAALLYGGMAGLGSGQVWEAVGCAVPILISAFVILYLYNGRRAARGRTFYKWFFYAFYPAHLLVLGMLLMAK